MTLNPLSSRPRVEIPDRPALSKAQETAITCAHCGATAHQPRRQINRAQRRGWSLYCSKACVAAARRMKVQPDRLSEVARACEMYRSGLSIRRASEQSGIDRETIRKAAKAAGIIRGRLAYQAPLAERLMNYDVQPNGCWLWRGHVNNMGYGQVSVNGRRCLAHRTMCAHVGRAIPAGLDACHACDTPRCVNPDHIFAGTRKDNMQDAAAKGRLRRRGAGC